MSHEHLHKIDSTPVSFYGLALRLRRGSSPITSWSCDRVTLPGTLTVGAGEGCDWSIRGPGVAPLELWVRIRDGHTEAKSAQPGRGATMDGERMGADWVTLEPGSRIEFGFACLALEFDAAPFGSSAQPLPSAPVTFLGSAVTEPTEQSGVKPSAAPSTDGGREPVPPTSAASAPGRPLQSSSAPREASRSHVVDPGFAPAGEARRASERPAPAAGRAAPHVPAVVAPARASRRSAVVYYVLMLVLTLCAYRGWLFLLER